MLAAACAASVLAAGCAASTDAASSVTVSTEAQSIADVAWIEGEWVTTRNDSEIRESWAVDGANAIRGMSCATRDGTVKVLERTRIEARSDGLYYVADPNGQQVTEFQLMESEPGMVLFGNPAHDWPQFVEYRRRGDRLEASASGIADAKERRSVWSYERTEVAEAACTPVPL